MLNKKENLKSITDFMQLKCREEQHDLNLRTFSNICNILNNSKKRELYNARLILRKYFIKALLGTEKTKKFEIIICKIIKNQLSKIWNTKILNYCVERKNQSLIRIPFTFIKLETINNIELIIYYQKNNEIRSMDHSLYNILLMLFKSWINLLIANTENIKYNRYKVKLLSNTEKHYRWTVTLPHDHPIAIEFFKSFLGFNIKPYINNLKTLKINYYLYTDKNYYPKEIKIMTLVFHKNIKEDLNKILMKFLSNWKKINLDEYYQKCFNGFFLIDIKCYNAQKLIMKDFKVPCNLDIRESKKNKMLRTNLNDYDFELII